MSVHYKFKSALDYDTVTFDGLHISVGDLKAAISQQKRIGKTSDFDLQITNAQTKEVYVDDNTLIPKNTSLLVARVPLSQQPKKQWEGSNSNTSTQQKDAALNKGLADLSRMEGSEQDKINAMITQSTFDYDPSNYQKIRGQNQRGIVPTTYICYKCQKRGHWIKDCPTANSSDPVDIRRSTGIPRSFMVPVEGPKAPGAMMTPSGTYAVPAVDHEAYLASENAGGADTPTNAPAAPEPNIPDELICSLCRDLLTDAVMIPCCGNSFCDECIRGALLESEDHECPDCREKEIAPTTLIPNRFLRNSVSSFRNQTGYSRRTPHRPSAPPMQARPPIMEPPPAAPMQQPANGGQPAMPNNDSGGPSRGPEYHRGRDGGSESDGSVDDNITVTVPPALTHPHQAARPPRHARAAPHAPHAHHAPHRPPRYGPPPNLKPPGLDTPPNIHSNQQMPRIDEQRASTPTIDERRDPITSQVVYNRGPPQFIPGVPPSRRYNNPPYDRHGPPRGSSLPFNDRYPPPEPYQPPPPGIKDSPTNGHGEDPLEAFNRMIREKEMRAKRREEERRRAQSGSRSRSRSPRSVRSRPSRSPPPRALRPSRSPPPRSPPPRSPPPRSPPPPRARLRSRGSSRLRYSRSRSISRGRLRRSPWSPRRRRTRERTLSLTRSPSPRRRHRSPLRYRSPLRSPGPRSLPRSPPRSLPRSPPRSPLRSPPRSPLRSPRRSAMRSPPPRLSPHRYTGVYDEMLSPPPRSTEQPYGSRYGSRGNAPPSMYPPMGVKPLLPLDNVPVLTDAPPGYRARYDPPPFEDIPPGVEPPVPGFEPSPFEKPPGLMDRERLPPPNFRDNYRPSSYVEGSGAFRDMPISNVQSEIPVHVGEQRYRDNFRPYRDQGSMPFRDGQPFREPGSQGPPYRDANFRGAGPPFRDNYRNLPYREGGYRENPPHSFRESGAPFRPPSADPRDQAPANYHDPNFRDGYRDENNVVRDHMRPGYRPSIRNRVGPRRNPNVEHDRHRDRDGRERERYPENPDRARELEKRSGYDKSREGREGRETRDGREPRDGREDRSRDYERSRDYDKDRDREHDRSTPDKKSRASPKRNRETRDKKRSESRGRSRDRESRREKREEKTRDKSADRMKEHKEKEKKIKDRKKKKREKEKEKEVEKKKKREKKEKKDKDVVKKEDDVAVKDETKTVSNDQEETESEKQKTSSPTENSQVDDKSVDIKSPNLQSDDKPEIDLYGDEAAEAVDKEIIQNYVKADENVESSDNKDANDINKDEPFDGIELQANADELDLKLEVETNNQNREMLAPLPELSKWEVDDDVEKSKEPGEISSPEEDDDGGKVTSDVIKRAENAIFAKAINSLRPIEIKKISSDRLKLYGDEQSKGSMNNIQITVPVTDTEQRSIEINEKKKRSSKTPPPRLSVKERLGGKVEDVRRPRESRVVHSTVERVKSRSKTPKKEQPYRRVTVERDRGRKPDAFNRLDSSKPDRRIIPESGKSTDKRSRSPINEMKKKDFDKNSKEEKNYHSESRGRAHDKEITSEVKNLNSDRERKKSTLDEAHFEPDYDEHLEFDNEAKDDSSKKRDRSGSPTGPSEIKKAKLETETIKLDLSNVKKKPDTESESSSESEYSSSSSSSDARKRKKKKKRNKKKKKRAASDSNSDSDSSSDDHKKKKKKRKHKKKSSKKKKKSKHK